MKEFFWGKKVFSVMELDLWLKTQNRFNVKTRDSLLDYHKKRGNLISLRKGLYAVVPSGMNSEKHAVDPWLFAAMLSTDSTISFHSALAWFGKTYTASNYFYCQSSARPCKTIYNNATYQQIPFNPVLKRKNREQFLVEKIQRDGVTIRVTSFERTMVDVLDKPKYCVNNEEVWRSLEMVEFFNYDKILSYVEVLEKGIVAAKVGFYLEQHQKELMIDEKYLQELEKMRPRQVCYFDSKSKGNGKFQQRWNLIVPNEILSKEWEEM